ncbi:hypothetical protein PYCCODRAFT_177186 [Trametes coccinea BRFM310]|uniref:Uncharacterized protein n=1 Tax=Trametes coccinea (strain BRFM310) TaxID=1353009 RepID=A0A1Y2ISJ0_TRAC3|nr:hypothetical protein PYCCODRAFT_177186 [Trametes coccinea BRFM310]
MNVNKRKLDAGNGPASDAPSTPSGSRSSAITTSPRGTRQGLPTPPASLPPRPGTSATSPSTIAAPSGPRAERQGGRQPPPHIRDQLASALHRPGTPLTSGGVDGDEAAQRSSKRARTDGRRNGRVDAPSVQTPGAADSGNGRGPESPNVEAPQPSLLSRLMGGVANGKEPASLPKESQRGQGHRNRIDRERNGTDPLVPAKRRAEPSADPAAQSSAARPLARLSRSSPDRDPVGGYSIRGAARAANRSSPVASDGPGSKGAASLLQRLQPLGEGGADEGGGRRGRKRGRHA